MDLGELIQQIQTAHTALQRKTVSVASVALTLRNWIIGAYIVEYEQGGSDRAAYGENLLPELAERVRIRGLSRSALQVCRDFYLTYPQIRQTLSGEFHNLLIQSGLEIRQTLTGKSSAPLPEIAADPAQLVSTLSFSHIVELLKLPNPLQRAFYEIEAIRGRWSVRELKRQVGSLLFERTGLSTDKEKLMRIAQADAAQMQPADIIRSPYIFEFLGLKPREAMSESDLEDALLDHLQEFLLELGNGFCFEARQKPIRIGATDYFVDLVFYHRVLKCHVLLELKIEPFTHANAGQLNTYLNYYRRHEMRDGDRPPIGILLCTDKDHALVEYALGGLDQQLFVSDYKVALPDESALQSFLDRELAQLRRYERHG
jgi:predicted nuclease of restriction endonuclease-like (RecB) superfamily